ncbi:MAG: thioredoxin family protein [Rhodococcus sp. (in: high G+C Gram-positive bacteria)]
MTAVVVLVVALTLAIAVGLWVRRREGAVRSSEAGASSGPRTDLLRTVGVTEGTVTVLHFSATWCGPCAAVRRVASSVVNDLAAAGRNVVDVEVDVDEHPALAKEFGVMSLPTTFVLDGSVQERFRASGVPSAADLRDAVSDAGGPAGS